MLGNKRARSSSPRSDKKKIKNGGPFKDVGIDTLVSGEKQYPTLVVPRNVLGVNTSKTHADTLQAFLDMNTGSGTTRQQFNFRMASEVNVRHFHWQLYRHRCADPNANIESLPYPAEFNVLKTKVDSRNIVVTGAPNTNVAVVQNPYQQMINSYCYISEMNRADMEDISWDLNKGKKHISGLHNISPPQLSFGHRKQSSLQANNNYFINPAVLMNNDRQNGTVDELKIDKNQFHYKANFFGGDLEYNFANKFNSGAHVEIIVFKIKKNANFSPYGTDTAATAATDRQRNPYFAFTERIKEGYVNKLRSQIGTDDFGGDDSLAEKTFTDPSTPFMQKTSYTKALPFKEVYRQKFALCAGGRKQVKIHLPGVCYDPTKILYTDAGALGPLSADPVIQNTYPLTKEPTGANLSIDSEPYNNVNGYSWDPNNSMIKTADQFSYTVCISCHGERLSLIVDPSLSFGEQSVHVAGDAFCKSDIMVQAQYTERIGAAVYSENKVQNVYTNGLVMKPTVQVLSDQGSSLSSVSTGHIIPLNRSVLTSSTKTTKVGNNESTVGTGVSGNSFRAELN